MIGLTVDGCVHTADATQHDSRVASAVCVADQFVFEYCERCCQPKPLLEFSIQAQRPASASDRNGCHSNGCGGVPASNNSSVVETRPAATNTTTPGMTVIYTMDRDSNPGPVFSIPGFGIGKFVSNPGIPAGLWDSGDVISKTVIFEYMGLYC